MIDWEPGYAEGLKRSWLFTASYYSVLEPSKILVKWALPCRLPVTKLLAKLNDPSLGLPLSYSSLGLR
jgi:hypothetical protein